MSIRTIITKSGAKKFEVECYSNGRGSERLKRRFNRKIEAENFEREFLDQRTRAKNAGSVTFYETTFRTEAEYWFEVQGKKFSSSHLKRVKGVLKELLPRLGDLTPDKFHVGFLSKLQSELTPGRFPGTVNRMTEVVMAILNFAAKNRRIPFNPSIGFEKLREVREEMKFWEEADAISFLNYANDRYPAVSSRRWVYVVYLLALNTALRAGEIWGLQPQDFVEDGEILFIRRQFDRVKKEYSHLKGKKPRRVPCNPELKLELENLVRKNGSSQVDPVFQGEKAFNVNHDSFADLFDREVRRWGGKRIRFHDLRHTATTLMILHGVDLKTVKEICGHKSISTTMNYSHLVERSVNRVAQTFSINPNSSKRGAEVIPFISRKEVSN
jgi:integrase